jgi:glutathione S-transferase
VLYESLIINLYLAKKYGTQLYPNSTEDEARSWQWTMWVMTEVEKPLFFVLLQRLRFPPGTPEARYFDEYQPVDPDQERAAIFQLQRPLAVLNRHLAARRYILGDTFTVADLNVASVLAATRVCALDLSREPHVVEWLERCLSRPAARQLL